MAESAENKRLLGRYQLSDRIGEGGSAVVYRAHDTWLGHQPVVLKLQRESQEDLTGHLRREYALLIRLRHPHIVRVRELAHLRAEDRLPDVPSEALCLIEDSVPGEPLHEWAEGRAIGDVAAVGAQIAAALAALHAAGVRHGDLQPDNILVHETPHGPHATLIDFGLSSRSSSGNTGGTPRFMAPEALEGNARATSDIYGLAATLAHVLGAPPPKSLGAAVQSPFCRRTLEAMGHQDASRRPTAAQAFTLFAEDSTPSCAPWLDQLQNATVSGGYIGRVEAREQIKRLLGSSKTGSQRLRITGPAGSGRTATGYEIAAQASLHGMRVPGTVRPARGGNLTTLLELSRELLAPAALREIQICIEAQPETPWSIFSAMVEAFRKSCKSSLVLIWDDVPPKSILSAFGAFLARQGEDAPPIIWVELADARAEENTASISLAPMTEPEVGAMLEAARPLRPEDTRAAAAISELSGGHPRLITAVLSRYPGPELLDAIQSGTLTLAKDELSRLQSQQARWTTELRMVLTALAHCPQPSPVRWLPPLTHLHQSLVEEALALGVREGLVVVQARGQEQMSALSSGALRESLLETASPDEVKSIAGAFDHLAPHERPHLEHAQTLLSLGEVHRAVPALLKGARQAAAQFSPHQALKLYEQIIQQDDIGRAEMSAALLESADVCLSLGLHQESIRRYQNSPPTVQAELGLAKAYMQCGRYKDVPPVLGDLMPELQPEDAEADIIYARALLLAGDLEACEKSLELAESRFEIHPRRNRLQATRGLVYFYRGEIRTARHILEDAYAQAKADQDPDLDALRSNLALILQKDHDVQGSRVLYSESLADARSKHDLPRQVIRLTNLGAIEHEDGRYEEALEFYREAWELARIIDGRREMVRVALSRSNLLNFLGDFEPAQTLLEQAITHADALEMTTELAYLELVRSEVHLGLGDPDSAQQSLSRARTLFEPAGNQARLVETIGVEAELALARQDYVRAAELGAEASAKAKELGRTRIAAQAKLWEAYAKGLEPSFGPDIGLEIAREALELARQLKEDDLAWPSAALAALMMERTGRQKQSNLYLEQARTAALRIYQKLSAQFEKTYAEVWHRRELWGYVQNVMDFGTRQPQETTSTAKTLDKLLAINRALSQDHNPDRLLERIIDAAITLSGAERGFIILKPEGSDELLMRAARNLDHVDMAGDDLEFSRSIAIEAMDRGAPLTTTDAQGDDRFNAFRSVHNLKLRSVLCLPLSAPPAIRGALYLDHRHRVNAFTDADTSMLGAFGDQAAIALANAQLVSELRSNSTELESSRATIEELNQRLNQELEAQQAELDAIRESRGESTSADVVSQFGMVGKSKGMQKVFRIISRVADKEVPVTILGQSGTGKELVARAIHSTGGEARTGQFVSVNCGAITPQLWESELFGHEKGAFTGAVRAKPGLVEIADKGTLFLDEIGDMPLDMQVKLLRLLQQREYRRVGGTRTLISSARIICATNCDLETMVRDGTFREDLWYRLNVVEVELPPLRERREDIALLVDHLLVKHGGTNPPTLTRQARAALLDYSWPGNIRELENEVMRAVALADGDILPDDLSTKLATARPMPTMPSRDGPLKDQVAGFEAMIIRETLEAVDGRVAKAAEKLGLTRAGLYKKINKHGINVNG